MFDLVTSAAAGGLTGILGVAVRLFADAWKTRANNAHELAVIREQRLSLLAEQEALARVETVRAEAARDLADADTLRASIAADRAAYSRGNSLWLVGVDVVRGLARPALSTYLCLLVTAIYFSPGGEPYRSEIIATVLYLATVAVTWYFGSRPVRAR